MIKMKLIVQDEERKLTKDYLVYETVTLIPNDPIIEKCVKEILDEFKGKPDSLELRATLDLS